MKLCHHSRAVVVPALAALIACTSTAPQLAADPARIAQSFAERRLTDALPELPPPASGWSSAQWLRAALALNPQLAEARARAMAVAAGELTARQRSNPSLNLFAEYLTAAAHSAAWLYGMSLDFMLQRPGERARVERLAALQTQAAQSDVAESIWEVREAIRQALLDAAYAHDEAALLAQLVTDQEALLRADRMRAQAGEIARTEVLAREQALSAARQRMRRSQAAGSDAKARLAMAVGVPVVALEEIPLQWPHWTAIGALVAPDSSALRSQALIGRPSLVRALREYDLAENALRGELAKRWPQMHLSPGYSWEPAGVRQDPLNDNVHESEIGLNIELPLFNRHEGPIGEARAQRELAGKHLQAVQAGLFAEIDRAERAWPLARQAWEDSSGAAVLAQRQSAAEARALAAGSSDRSSMLLADIAALESQLLALTAAYDAQLAFGALEDAYHRPLQGDE